jgi:hypothetical protein
VKLGLQTDGKHTSGLTVTVNRVQWRISGLGRKELTKDGENV